jgi:CBS domain-containing protein
MRASELMRTKFLTVSVDDKVTVALGRLASGVHHSAIVVDSRDRYVGLLDKEGCLRSRGDLGNMKVRHVLRKTSRLEESTDIVRVAQLLQAADSHILPVLDKYKRVAGIVGARDVIVALVEKLRGMRVSDLATKYPIVLSEDDSVAKAIELIKRKKVSRIPVIDDKRKLVGVVTRFDLLTRYMVRPSDSKEGAKGSFAALPNRSPSKSSTISVSDIMVKSVETVAPGTMLNAAARKMADANISDLIVVENDLPVAILTTKDILGRLAK